MILKLLIHAVARFYLRNPEQGEFLLTRYSTWRSVVREGRNQLRYLLRQTRSFGLTSIQLEVTNHCNMQCPMCPVNHEMEREKGFMDFSLFKRIVDENPEAEFFLLMNWGEPLLHPRLFEMIRYIRQRKGRALLTTNGKLLTEVNMRALIESGLDRVTVSLDGVGSVYESIRGLPYSEIKERIQKFVALRDDLKSTMAIDVNMVVFEETEATVHAFECEWQKVVNRVQVQPKLEFSGIRKKRCKELWRGNLIVLWNGTVVPCCVDYDGKMALGNANNSTLSEIFNSDAAQRVRELHNSGQWMGPCATCSEFKTSVVKPRFE